MRLYLIAFVLLLSGALATAQEASGNWCGLHQHEGAGEGLVTRLLTNKAVAGQGIVSSRDIQYVPITFHVVADDNGNGRIDENRVLDQLCELNEDYLPYDIQYYLKDGQFNYIDDSDIFSNHLSTINTLMTNQRDNRSMNIWIVESVDDPNDQNPGTTLAYYSIPKDWIVIRKGSVKGSGIELAHEIGHFYSLDHTFYGWETNPFGDEISEIGVNAPTETPWGNDTEKMNGTNCEYAGDRLCDTPPDYNNGLGNPGCEFTGNVLDPNGVQIDPDEGNYLSYFLNCSDEDYHFSPQQNDIIQVDLNSNYRNHLFFDPMPSLQAITEEPALIYPVSGETTDSYNSINLQWSEVPGATAYLLEVSRLVTFAVNTTRLVVYGNSKVMNNLDANKTYYWRVRPYNAHYTCNDVTSDTESFRTAGTTTIQEPGFVLEWRVAPNPVRAQQDLMLQISTSEAFRAEVGIYDINGRLVRSPGQIAFAAGENNVPVATDGLAAGMYILRVLTDVGQLTEKVIIGN